MATTAAAISGALRRGGMNPLGSGTPRTREGLRVTGAGSNQTTVRVSADLDSFNAAERMANEARTILIEAGYKIADGLGDTSSFYVTGKAA